MKKQIILYIDTSKSDRTSISLKINQNKKIKKEVLLPKKAENALILIEKLLKENNLKIQDVTKIKVHQGPGSFVGLRVGLTIANTLAFLLKIPINGVKPPLLAKYK